MKSGKLIVIALVAALFAAFFAFDLGQYLSLAFIKNKQADITAFYAANQVQTIAGFFAIYVTVAALSLPGAAIMTLVAGAIFGVVTGTIIVSFASSIGATLAFLAARLVLRDSIQAKFGDK